MFVEPFAADVNICYRPSRGNMSILRATSSLTRTLHWLFCRCWRGVDNRRVTCNVKTPYLNVTMQMAGILTDLPTWLTCLRRRT